MDTLLNQSVEKGNATFSGSELSSIRFCLAPEVSFSEQQHRGEIWVIIQNNVSNKQFSTTPLVREFVERFKEPCTLSEAMDKFSGADQLPQDEWLDLLSKLMHADVLNSPDMNHDEYRLQAHLDHQSHAKKTKWSRPWMVKIPLGNPNVLLTKVSHSTKFIWSTPVFILWFLVIAFGAIKAIEHFSSLQHFWSTRFLDPNNFILALLIYPVLKFLHEMGHGLAAKHWGADVVETGVLLILFVPLPYIDVSQSSFFKEKHQRMFVAAAGMMFELTIAVLALAVWLSTDSIILQDMCMNIILIGAVSSIFFNANPLLKFDGYYLLSDFLEIPNLSTRAAQAIKYVLYKKVFYLPVETTANSIAEARWLFGYGVLSQCYRLMISFYIALYLGSQYFFIGVSLALWLVANQILKPWFLGLRALCEHAKKHSATKRIYTVLGSFGVFLIIFVFVLPFQFNRTFSGILMLDGPAQVQAHASGFINKIWVKHDDLVEKDQPLFSLINSDIDAELSYLEAKITEAEVLNHQFQASDPAQAAYHADQVSAYRQEWQNLQQEQQSMIIRSPVKGHFQKQSLASFKGRYISKGDRLGDVISSKYASIVLMLTEEEMKKVGRFQRAQVVLHSSPSSLYSVAEVQATPAAIQQLPSPFLGSLYGGDVPVDSRVSEGVELLKPMFQVKLGINAPQGKPLIGSRASLKFTGSGQTLGSIAYQKVITTLRERSILD